MYYTKIVFSPHVKYKVGVGDAMLDEPPGCGVKCHNPAPLIFTKLAKPAFLAFVRNTTEVGGAV